MGYETNFILIIDPEPEEDCLVDFILTQEGIRYGYTFDRGSSGTYYGGSWKWYDHESDMLGFSILYPDYVFILEGDGEETGDHWVTYFKNGKFYTKSLVIPIPPFDESLLG